MYVYAGAGFQVGGHVTLYAPVSTAQELEAGPQARLRNIMAGMSDRYANLTVQVVPRNYTPGYIYGGTIPAATVYVTGTSLTDRSSDADIISDVAGAAYQAGMQCSPSDFSISVNNNYSGNPYAANPGSAAEAQRQKEVAQQDAYLKTLDQQSSFLYQFGEQAKKDINTPLIPGIPAWALALVAAVVVIKLTRG